MARATKKPEPVEGQLAEFAAKLALEATLLSTFVFVMTKHPPQNIYFRDLVLCFALYAFLGVLEDGLGCVSATSLNVSNSWSKYSLRVMDPLDASLVDQALGVVADYFICSPLSSYSSMTRIMRGGDSICIGDSSRHAKDCST